MLIEKPILTVEEVAHVLGTNDQGVYKLVHSGQIEAYKDLGTRRWKITGESVQKYLEDMVILFRNNLIQNMPNN